MLRYEVRHHKGRSGKSVFAWRVYSVMTVGFSRKRKTQLAKYKTEAEAQRCREHFEAADARRAQEAKERAARYAAQAV